MKLIRLTFEDLVTGWNVKDLYFNNLTLLVGTSGVGKTLILRSIERLAHFAEGFSAGAISWSLDFTIKDEKYHWEGALDTRKELPEDFERNFPIFPIRNEQLKKTAGGKEVVLIERTADRMLFNGNPTVRLDARQSAIALLKEESEIRPVFEAFQRIFILRTDVNARSTGLASGFSSREAIPTIESINELNQIPLRNPLLKLFILYKNGLKEFEEIREQFTDIFPLVESIDFTLNNYFNDYVQPRLRIKEKGVDEWIDQGNVSSGMIRTLVHIVEIVLAQPGDIFLIDEFENGLGINCISDVADLVVEPDADIQFVITSHHPYIINNIDIRKWKIVTRRGSDVTVYNSADLNIGRHSHHEAFMQLLQTDAYKTGTP